MATLNFRRLQCLLKKLKKGLIPSIWDVSPEGEEFMRVHLNRNAFNIGAVRTLQRSERGVYVDENNRIWHELNPVLNYFHLPRDTKLQSMTLGQYHEQARWTRKFLSEDGRGGEYEMVVDKRGLRITEGEFQETYNFRPSSNWADHIRFDIKPHLVNLRYAYYGNKGRVLIKDQI